MPQPPLPPSTPPPSDLDRKLAAAIELLTATRRDLQIVDKLIAQLANGQPGVSLADDVSSEHRAAFLGCVDDNDGLDGILIHPSANDASNWGLVGSLRHTGTIRNGEDAAFVCTDILVASAQMSGAGLGTNDFFFEGDDTTMVPFLKMTDGSSGRSLINGLSQGPIDNDRGIVPVEFLSAIRPGLGANYKNRLFSEFTIPRGGTVRCEGFILAPRSGGQTVNNRLFVSLLGYKVYGA